MHTFSPGNVSKRPPHQEQGRLQESNLTTRCSPVNIEATISCSNGKIHSSSTPKGSKFIGNLGNAEFQCCLTRRGKSILKTTAKDWKGHLLDAIELIIKRLAFKPYA